MNSIAFADAVSAYDAIEVALDKIEALDCDALSTGERFELLGRSERVRRRLPTGEHELINQLDAYASAEELGGKLARTLANRLRINRGEATRRIGEAGDLGPRRR